MCKAIPMTLALAALHAGAPGWLQADPPEPAQASDAPVTVAAPGGSAGGANVFSGAGGTGGSGGFGGGNVFSGAGGTAGGSGGIGGGIFAAPGRNSGQPLIVRTSESNSSTTREINEDLTVMSRILTKAAAEGGNGDAQDFAMGIVVSALGGDQQIRSLYLDGYGALFLLNVRMPLLPPPPMKEAEKKETPPVETTWEQTKRELYGLQGTGADSSVSPGWRAYQDAFSNMQRRFGPRAEGASTVKYDAEKVETLKKHLLEALKNATNIRHLDSGEWITIAVTGAARSSSRRGPGRELTPYLEMPNGETVPTSLTGEPILPTTNTRTMLAIRVRKADVDAFAKGKLSSEEFQRKASIATY